MAGVGSPRRTTNRSWPPLVSLTVSFLMVFVAFPNPFSVPNNNPNATAELAPVPGKQESSDQSNFSETGFANSRGLGAGDGNVPGLPPLPPPPPGDDIPLDKECVEGRQTEDPLSPPCVPYYSGNNGGHTYHGVTKDEIRVVFYQDVCRISPGKEELSTSYKPTDECGTSFETVNLIKTIKAHLQYFQRRFQTYGRRIRLIAQNTTGVKPENRRRDAQTAVLKWDPFSAVFLGDNAEDYFAELASPNHRRPSFGLNFDVKAQYYEDYRPFVWSMMPDQETEGRWTASFICNVILGGAQGIQDIDSRPKARFSTDPKLVNQPRRIGFIYGKDSSRGPQMEEMAELLKGYTREQCGFDLDDRTSGNSRTETYENTSNQAGANAGLVIARMKTNPDRSGSPRPDKPITTIICYCIPVPPEQTVTKFQGAAAGSDYYPEWYWDHVSAMDRPIWHQTYAADQSGKHASFGSTYFWKQPAFRQQVQYRAYQDQTRDNSTPNVRFNFTVYYLFLNLFTAIQAAGPKLTPEAVEQGMFTFRYTNPDFVDLPTGSYGLAGPSPYTFIDTAMGWYWNRNGIPPGRQQPEGCFHVMNGGKRYWSQIDAERYRSAMRALGTTTRTWPIGDAGLFRPGPIQGYADPCTEDTRKLQDPGPNDNH